MKTDWRQITRYPNQSGSSQASGFTNGKNLGQNWIEVEFYMNVNIRISMAKLPRLLLNMKEESSQKTAPMPPYFIAYLTQGCLVRRRL